MSTKCLLFLLFFGAMISNVVLGQAPNLASARDFAVFTSAGAFNNSGNTVINGDIGTKAGAFSFSPGVVVGETHVADEVSILAASDLAGAYGELSALTCGLPLDVTLGNNQVLEPNVYCTGAASTLNGTLFLDAKGDPNAVFIFKIDGAFATGTGSNVVLLNSASFNNVYWQVTGRFDLGDNSLFRGNVLGGGAIELLEGSAIVGRALTTAGAISLHNNKVVSSEAALPVTLTSFDAKLTDANTARLLWATTAETNSDRFEIERSANGKKWQKLNTVPAKGKSSSLVRYEYEDQHLWKGANMYRLKMIDTDETFTYSRIRIVKSTAEEKMALFPNPMIDKLTLAIADMSQVDRIKILDITGRAMIVKERKDSSELSAEIDVSQLSSGMYVVQISRKDSPDAFVKVVKR